MKITLFARGHRNQNGKLSQQQIDLTSQHPYRYYTPAYGYCAPHCSIQQTGLLPSSGATSDGDYVEYLVRARRCIAFADAADLKPIKFNQRKHRTMLESLRTACSLDHTTVWLSLCGTTFILTEPYTVLQHSPSVLAKTGFTYITVPESLSPYCGGWGSTPDASPGTKSYLICAVIHQAELAAIEEILRAESGITPIWNDLVGVTYV
jgi:hypothetical protein